MAVTCRPSMRRAISLVPPSAVDATGAESVAGARLGVVVGATTREDGAKGVEDDEVTLGAPGAGVLPTGMEPAPAAAGATGSAGATTTTDTGAAASTATAGAARMATATSPHDSALAEGRRVVVGCTPSPPGQPAPPVLALLLLRPLRRGSAA